MSTPTVDAVPADRARRRPDPSAAGRGRAARPRAAAAARCRTRCASSTRARSGATRSCSSSRSARSSPPCWPSATRPWFSWLITGLAVADGRLRQPGRGGRRGPRQGAGRGAAPGQDRHGRPPAARLGGRRRPDPRRGRGRAGPGAAAAAGRRRRGRGRGVHPRGRRRARRHRQRRRVGDHRRVRAGDPGVRRRPLVGHRRHPGAVRPDRRADHAAARRELHRPDDRPGRGCRAAEDAERDRAEHPARRR